MTAYLYRSVEHTVTYMSKLVDEKQKREEEMAMSNNVKDTLLSTFTTLEKGFLSQMESLQGFMDRETWLKSQLRESEQNNHKLLEEPHKVSMRKTRLQPQLQDVQENHKEELFEQKGVFKNKERENSKQLREVQQQKHRMKKNILALKSSIQTRNAQSRKGQEPR